MARDKFKPVYNFMSTCDEKNNKNLPVPLKNTYLAITIIFHFFSKNENIYSIT